MAAILSLLISLPFSHPSINPLLEAHKPFSYPSSLPQSSLNKYVNRLNTILLSRDDGIERRAAADIAQAVVAQDEEGWVITNFGKGWTGACLGHIASSTTPTTHVSPHLALMATLVISASGYPSFEREVIHPIMGKLSVSLGKLFERTLAESSPQWDVILLLIRTIQTLLIHSPANYRPLVPTLKPALLMLILQLPSPSRPFPIAAPAEIRSAASGLIASVHVTAGKAQAPQSWGMDMRDAIGGFSKAMGGITAEAWEGEPVKVQPPAASSGLPDLPVDPSLRLPAALEWVEGYANVILALLRFPTSRPVPVPIAQIVSAGLRCISITLDTPTVPYISPQHHAALLAALPRIWTAGLQLLGGVALACGEHIFPHLGSILDHTVWLAERLPSSMTEPQVQLTKFHQILLTLFPPALLAVEYPTRLLRLCLTRLQPLLENKSKSLADVTAQASVGGKRGKKRARGAEDGLVGGLEGREGRTVSVVECKAILEALRLTPLLHPTPLLSPSLLTFSIRLHLSLYLSIPSMASVFSNSATLSEVKSGLSNALEKAVCMTEGESGTGRGWKSLIVSVLDHKSESLAPILHPSLPPLQRPMPPLSQLHLFVKEGDAERKERVGMGFGSLEDPEDVQEEVGEEMRVDKVAVQRSQAQTPVTLPLLSNFSATPSSVALVQPTPAPVAPLASTAQTTTTTVAAPSTSVSALSAVSGSAPTEVVEESTQVTKQTEFISAPSGSGSVTKTSVKETKETNLHAEADGGLGEGDVIMLNDDDDEGIPDLDSGSDDELDGDEDDDDDDDEDEEDE